MIEAASFVRLAAAALVAAAVSVSLACGNRPPADNPEDYVRRVLASRAAKDADFQKASEPILDEKKATFLPLAYFPVDPSYNVVAGLEPEKEEIVVMMPTSTGQMRKMRQVGQMHFTLKGQPMSLVSFVEVGAPDMNRLTLMFSDMTSGTETYAAGRYLDLDRTASDLYSLDFNLAYHPYCYYNPAYDCPFPPAENRLNVPIHAGERMRKPGETAASPR
ncbi:MAG: DUF1684 domain-containing protein [Vicinamibacterales bacterium]